MTKELPWSNQQGLSPSNKFSASRMNVRSRKPVYQWWRESEAPKAPPSIYLSWSVVTVTPQTPAYTTYKSTIQNVFLGRPMQTIQPFMNDWRQVKSRSVSSRQPLIKPIWLCPHYTNHWHTLLELGNPFHLKPRILMHRELRILSISHIGAFT